MDSVNHMQLEHRARVDYVYAELEPRWQQRTGSAEVPVDFARTIVKSCLDNAATEGRAQSILEVIIDQVAIGSSGIITERALAVATDGTELERLAGIYEANGSYVRQCANCGGEIKVPIELRDEVRSQQPFTQNAAKIAQKPGQPYAAAVINLYCDKNCADLHRKQ